MGKRIKRKQQSREGGDEKWSERGVQELIIL